MPTATSRCILVGILASAISAIPANAKYLLEQPITSVSSQLEVEGVQMRCAGLMTFLWFNEGDVPYKELRQAHLDRAISAVKSKSRLSPVMLGVAASQESVKISDQYGKISRKRSGRKIVSADEEFCAKQL